MTLQKLSLGLACLLTTVAGCDLMSMLPQTDWVAQARTDIKDHPVIVEHIGEITSFEVDDDASANFPGENDFVFRIQGSKGSGTLTATCVTIDEFTEDITAGYLEIDGQKYELFPGVSMESEAMLDDGLEAFAAQVLADLENNPVLAEHLGAITSITYNEEVSNSLDGEDDFAFNLVGEKGKGVISATCITIDEDHEDVTAGTLKLENGEEHNLFPQ